MSGIAFEARTPSGGTEPVPLGAKVINQGDGRYRRPTPTDREQSKFGYFVNEENKIVVLPGNLIRSHHLQQ